MVARCQILGTWHFDHVHAQRRRPAAPDADPPQTVGPAPLHGPLPAPVTAVRPRAAASPDTGTPPPTSSAAGRRRCSPNAPGNGGSRGRGRRVGKSGPRMSRRSLTSLTSPRSATGDYGPPVRPWEIWRLVTVTVTVTVTTWSGAAWHPPTTWPWGFRRRGRQGRRARRPGRDSCGWAAGTGRDGPAGADAGVAADAMRSGAAGCARAHGAACRRRRLRRAALLGRPDPIRTRARGGAGGPAVRRRGARRGDGVRRAGRCAECCGYGGRRDRRGCRWQGARARNP